MLDFPLSAVLLKISGSTRGMHRRLDLGRARAFADPVDLGPLEQVRGGEGRAYVCMCACVCVVVGRGLNALPLRPAPLVLNVAPEAREPAAPALPFRPGWLHPYPGCTRCTHSQALSPPQRPRANMQLITLDLQLE